MADVVCYIFYYVVIHVDEKSQTLDLGSPNVPSDFSCLIKKCQECLRLQSYSCSNGSLTSSLTNLS